MHINAFKKKESNVGGMVKDSNKIKVTKDKFPHNSRHTFKYENKKQLDKIITLFSYL